MPNPKISIIIPVYNVEKYISECLDLDDFLDLKACKIAYNAAKDGYYDIINLEHMIILLKILYRFWCLII